MSKKVTITLTVQASALYGLDDPTKTEVESKCELTDDNSGTSSNGIEDFTSQVYVDHDVKWEGEVKYPDGVDKDYSIAIYSIDYNSNVNNNVNFFDESIISGGNSRNATVKKKVKDDSSLVNKIDDYTINFRIFKTADDYKAFSVDPKLQANPK
ncbi:hypothetical protein [Mangrovimonas sp. YM274]|uniref:hypothetical protein n=1 Tax=Mangrovimonas sp. YM274 TaxID=3070660 RepID=UPI0027DBBE36|nr:hypothetical protein [Mangrovimonas sp. YM274]WMI67344.1 hypothetical protein RBH95_09305 [Mangrovimonas sp. YM274]